MALGHGLPGELRDDGGALPGALAPKMPTAICADWPSMSTAARRSSSCRPARSGCATTTPIWSFSPRTASAGASRSTSAGSVSLRHSRPTDCACCMTADQRQATKQLCWLHEWEHHQKKKIVAERLAAVENQLNFFGYAKIQLQDLKNPLLTVEKLASVVEKLESSR
eukprot:2991203-Rhodomonas_salina.1